MRSRVWLLLALATLALGAALNLWRPLYLTPPYVEATGVVYGALALAWIPVLALAARGRRDGRAGTAVLWSLVVVGLLASMFVFCAVPLPIGTFAAPLDCWKVGGTAPLQYQCWAERMFYGEIYSFESIDGLPVMRLVDHELVNK